MNASDDSERNALLVLGLILVTGCILRCWNINQSFWWDEIWSTLPYARAHSVWHIFTELGYYFNNHLLNSLLVRYSIKVFGESEWVARLPALFMGLLALVALFRFGMRFSGALCAGTAALLLAFSPFHIDHSTEARGYSGLSLFAILSSFYFLRGLKTDERWSWICYACFTVLGFCSHVFMVAVSVSQFFFAALLMAGVRWLPARTYTTPRAVRNLVISLLCAGAVTLLIYSPILPAFFENMGKVRLVNVTRVPFMAGLVNSFLFPGMATVPGSIVYGALLCSGLYVILRKDPLLLGYLLVLFSLPLSLYLLINPMFVSERYFIFVLPFALLVISQGIAALAGGLRPGFRIPVVIILTALIAFLQYPAIAAQLTRDRQSYREAVRCVEEHARAGDLVFSLGYAGEHFRYYAAAVTVLTPETPDQLSGLMDGKQRAWCLITAWLRDIRPSHEDAALYAERPGQAEIYDYVKQHFKLVRRFPSRYPVDVYFLEH